MSLTLTRFLKPKTLARRDSSFSILRSPPQAVSPSPYTLNLSLMGKEEKLKSILTAFTPDGGCLAILSPDGSVKVWNTSNGSQFAEWKETDENSSISFSCISCSFVGKMRRKERGTCLIALGTDNGDVSVVNISLGKVLWKSTSLHPGGIASLSFRSKGSRLHVFATGGAATELISENGEITRELKISKKSVASAAYLSDDKVIAAVGHKFRVVSLDDGKEVLKFSSGLDSVQCISSSGDAKFIVASGDGEKRLQLWKCDFGTRNIDNTLVLSMKHRPLRIECRNGCDGEGVIVLSVSEAGVAYVWNLKSVSDDVNPTKISVKDDTSKLDSVNSGRAKRNRISIIAARIHALEATGQVKVLISFGSVDGPHFTAVVIATPGQDVIINATDITLQENGVHIEDGASKQKEKSKKKRSAPDLEIASGVDLIYDSHGDPNDGVQIDDDLNEPTMGEKLANLNLVEVNEQHADDRAKPPSADSVHVLLKQALHADDRALLIDCLFRQDEKVVANSVSALNPSDVLKLLRSLVSMIQSRGAVLACTLPWLRSLLLQHASGIMSQESSLVTLNTLYQLIESRVSTFNQTLQLSSSLDLLYAGSFDTGSSDKEDNTITPAFYEDKDESEEDVSAESMEIESDDDGKEPETLSDISDFEGME